jgi:biopolymer transport protein ExbB
MNIFTDFITIMDKGGPIMWVIFIAASLAIVLLIWQGKKIFTYLKLSVCDQERLTKSTDYLPEFSNSKILSPLAQLLLLLNWSEIKNKEDFAREMNVHMSDIALKIEGSLPTIAIIGSLLPMLGLLGTVTGMINVFEVIAVHGSGKPDEMAHGISEAMLTTASGLIIAIPVIFTHHLLSQRQTLIMTNLVQSMQTILHNDLDIMKKNIAPAMGEKVSEETDSNSSNSAIGDNP